MKKIFFIIVCLCIFGCKNRVTNTPNEVVVYTAVDEIFADQIIKDFEIETGIKVNVVYDTEANKTTGLVNRIIAEKEHPICDVFWNNEFIQTIALEKQDLLSSYESISANDIPDYYKSSNDKWTAFGGRARVLLVNNDRLAKSEFPTSVTDFTNGKYEGKDLAIAYPMFGTTKTMAAALYAQWGSEIARKYFQDIVDRGVNIVDGNSVTKDMASSGQVAIGFTDSDDAREALKDGANVTIIYPDQGDGNMGTLITPSTIAMIKGTQNDIIAKKFIDYILSERIERKLVDLGFFDLSIRDLQNPNSIKGMSLSLEKIYNCLDQSTKDMEEMFSIAK